MEALKQISSDDAGHNGLLFEKIVVDMMDLGLNDGVLSSTDIPGILNEKGWDFTQVANTWSVGTEPLQWDTWNYASLDFLGGKNCLSKVWSVLRDEKLTGKVKRKVVSPSPVKTVKLARYDSSASKVLSLMAASSIDNAGTFDQPMPSLPPNSNPKCLSFPEVLPGCFETEGGEAIHNKSKTPEAEEGRRVAKERCS